MKKHRGLFALILITILAVGYAFYDVRSEKATDEKKATDDLIFHLDQSQFKTLQYYEQDPATSTLELTKDGDTWKITKPIEEAADQGSVTSYLSSLATEKKDSEIKQDKIDPHVFGFDKPKGQLKIEMTGEQPRTVLVTLGSAQNVDGDYYLRLNDENRVLVVNSMWTAKVTKRAFDFRNRKLLLDGPKDIEAIKITNPGEAALSLKYVDGKWADADHPDVKIDQSTLHVALDILGNNAIQEFLSEKPATPADLQKLQVKGPPAASWVVTLKGDKKEKLDFYQDPKKSGVARARGKLVRLGQPDVEKLISIQLKKILDHKWYFDLPSEDKIKKILVSKKGDEKTLEMNDPKAKTLLQALKSLSSIDEADKKTKAPGELIRIVGMDDKSEKIFSVDIEDSARPRKLVQTSLSPRWIELDDTVLKNLKIDELFKKDVPTPAGVSPGSGAGGVPGVPPPPPPGPPPSMPPLPPPNSASPGKGR